MTDRSGGDFLARKSDMVKSRKGMPAFRDILIVEDESFDADRLRATLHIMFGYGIEIRSAKNAGQRPRCRARAKARDHLPRRLPEAE